MFDGSQSRIVRNLGQRFVHAYIWINNSNLQIGSSDGFGFGWNVLQKLSDNSTFSTVDDDSNRNHCIRYARSDWNSYRYILIDTRIVRIFHLIFFSQIFSGFFFLHFSILPKSFFFSLICICIWCIDSVPLYVGTLITFVEVFPYLEKLGLRKLELLFGFLITIKAITFGYEVSKKQTNKIIFIISHLPVTGFLLMIFYF